jgi:diguanylate cyclase (GGDEF)-like protein
VACVIVVEDDADVRLLLTLALEGAGHRVVDVADGHDLLSLARSERPDLVLLDAALPERGGVDLLIDLKGAPDLQHIAVIFVTAQADTAHIVAALDHGAVDYVVKPFSDRELLARVTVALRGRATERGLRRDLYRTTLESELDPVTGGPNRRHVNAELDRRWITYGSSNEMSVISLDLDGFKELNDVHGHDTGDKALAYVSGYLRAQLRPLDAFGRWGGDEFVVVLADVDAPIAESVASRLVFLCRGDKQLQGWGLTISAGVATRGPTHHRPADLIAEADRALYKAKAAGGDRYVPAD